MACRARSSRARASDAEVGGSIELIILSREILLELDALTRFDGKPDAAMADAIGRSRRSTSSDWRIASRRSA